MGTTHASCGHALPADDWGHEVISRGEDCDAVDGFAPCVHYITYCADCAQRARGWPEWLPDHETADRWLCDASAANWKDQKVRDRLLFGSYPPATPDPTP